MAAYIIALVQVTDPEKFAAYQAQASVSVERYGGRFIANSEDVRVLEGDSRPDKIVLVEFPSLERLREFYYSPDYQQDIRSREGAVTMKILGVEGA